MGASSVLWSIEYEANEELYQADWKVLNNLRDNRFGHVRSKKVVRDLQPRRGNTSASASTPGGEARSAERVKPAQAPSFFPKKEEAKDAEKPVKQEPKLSAAEQRMKELASGGKPAVKAPKLSMAEQRMKDLLGGNKSAKNDAKKAVKEDNKPAAEGSEDEEEEKTEIKPALGFDFDFEKKPIAADEAKARGSPPTKESKKTSKKKGSKSKNDDFINDDSDSSDGQGITRKRKFHPNPYHNSDSEEEIFGRRREKPTVNKYKKLVLNDSDDDEVDKTKKNHGEEANEGTENVNCAKKNVQEEESSGDESDSSHSSQHTNASDPGKMEQEEDDGEQEDGKLVIVKKGKGSDKEGKDDEVGSKSKRKKKSAATDEETEKPKKKRKQADADSDQEGEVKKKRTTKKEVELDYAQKTLDVSQFSASNASKAKRKRKVTRTRMDEKGYIVTEEVWEEYSDEETKGEDEAKETKSVSVRDQSAFAMAEEKKGSEGKEKKESKESKSKTKGNASKPQPAVKKQQAGIASFFKKA
eukprot:748060-Hanusia_phi.AAC.3